MELKVNGQHIDITLEDERTVGEVLKAFEAEADKNGATTVSITLNGKNISAEAFEEAANEPLTDTTVLELEVISQAELNREFAEARKAFTELSRQLSSVSVLLQSGKDTEANSIITCLASKIDQFCHTATLAALFPDTYRTLNIAGSEAGAFFEELAPILSDFEKALAAKDTVTVGDLAEYEIAPRLEQLASAIGTLDTEAST